MVCKDCKTMRRKYQIENELKHQKQLALKSKGFDDAVTHTYWTRVHLLSWVLGESTTF